MTNLFGILANAKLRILLSQKIGHILHVYFEERATSCEFLGTATFLLKLLDALKDVVHAARYQAAMLPVRGARHIRALHRECFSGASLSIRKDGAIEAGKRLVTYWFADEVENICLGGCFVKSVVIFELHALSFRKNINATTGSY